MSNVKLKKALYSVNQLLKNMDGYSYASRDDMRHMLNRSIKDLHELGFKLTHINGLKPKHIHVLVEHWQTQGKNPATIKNYMAKLRKTAVLINKPQLVKARNDDYHIKQRAYAPTFNKAINTLDLSSCRDSLIRLSLEAQLLFGLRREESMKLILSDAWRGDYLVIKPSWTKGGIGRTLEITNDEQRQWLLKAIQVVPKGQSLIPKERSYKQHLSYYQLELKHLGLSKCHGLRHAYAQRRYHELTRELDKQQQGWACPIAGGPATRSLNKYEKIIDKQAREILSRELGHSRLAIVKIYCA